MHFSSKLIQLFVMQVLKWLPFAVYQSLLRAKVLFVGHFRTLLDPVTQV